MRTMLVSIPPAIRTSVDFQLEKNVPADGIRLPFSASGNLGTSPFLGSSRSRQISLTARHDTIFLAHTKGSKEKRCALRAKHVQAFAAPQCRVTDQNFSDLFALQESLVGPLLRWAAGRSSSAIWGAADVALL
jgi:hypothetical protein